MDDRKKRLWAEIENQAKVKVEDYDFDVAALLWYFLEVVIPKMDSTLIMADQMSRSESTRRAVYSEFLILARDEYPEHLKKREADKQN